MRFRRAVQATDRADTPTDGRKTPSKPHPVLSIEQPWSLLRRTGAGVTTSVVGARKDNLKRTYEATRLTLFNEMEV